MPTEHPLDDAAVLALDRYQGLIASAAATLARSASAAGPTADVPTCPRWSAVDLLAHQGLVHRWATSHLRGHDGRTPEGRPLPTKSAYLRTVPADELAGWVVAGAADLVTALAEAPADLRAMTFLREAPAPRLFWARRQTHETTVHAVDGVAARLGRMPTTAEATDALSLTPDVAADGLDELLRGFITRGAAKIRRDAPYTVLVEPSDVDAAWLLHVDEAVVTRRLGGGADPVDAPARAADVRLTGTAAALYLGLWNRGDEIAAEGLPDFLDTWRRSQRVRWS
ncbi:maleylpyruvate isomerase N-terminal domain-containing protein [Actinotalea ferrariae]|uniref:maleylpyruvate isomerase N-terminal domain-containing protein n=1 Tax=Actinotalea ferrariae TaxID=1386098 RepID=UPI001C8C0ABB|nr:maleylpyruvate isomerase N-terminal domain-containing protein [Actinotalea ferrariae]MBX9245300.1 maleylpyruvate isomerase N-terminal domain-containing protein [Actinotalea ferrariae]